MHKINIWRRKRLEQLAATLSAQFKENVFWLQLAALKEPAELVSNTQKISQREARTTDQ